MRTRRNPFCLHRKTLMMASVSASFLSPISRICCSQVAVCSSRLYRTCSRPWLRWRLGLPRRILAVRQEVRDLRTTAFDNEQSSHRASIRVFAAPEDTPNSTDNSLLVLCNDFMNIPPPLQLDEILVSHRVDRLENIQRMCLPTCFLMITTIEFPRWTELKTSVNSSNIF